VSVFETLRERVPIEEIVGRYSEVRSNKARCVASDHEDVNPSMRIYHDHVHCFACAFHGDVVDVWAALKGFARPIEAALDLGREYGVELPGRDPEAEHKAEERRRREAQCMREAKERHEALAQHPLVEDWWLSRGFGEERQQRYLLGASADGTAATLPYWHRGRVQGIVQRKLEGKPKYINPLGEDLPDGHKPLFIPGSVGPDSYVVEGFLDGLALDAMGESVVVVGGTNANEAQLRELKRLPGELRILPDDDKEGMKAAKELAREIYPKARVCPAEYGEGRKDVADLFATKSKEETFDALQEIKKASQDFMDIEAEAAAELEDPRQRLTYAVEHVVPLACELSTEIAQEAALEVAAQKMCDVKAAWLKRAHKEEQERRERETFLHEAKKRAEAEAEARRRYLAKVDAASDEIAEIFGKPGVLERFREDAAEMHGVVGDENALKLVALVAFGAQLKPLPNGRPLGPSVLLTAPPGRGKNHLVDSVVRLLPEEFYVAFKVASAQAFYYAVETDPAFLKHKFAYPNEIEAVDTLVEFLRPMLSAWKAVKFTVNKDAVGANVAQELEVEGPITTAIPTIRNKTDEQLHARLLVGELPDYEGRVKSHSAAFSELLLPDYAATDNSHNRFLWSVGLRQLAQRRRVVFPLEHPDFALDNDDLSHGARTWANLLGLMCAHAWLEQHNRHVVELATGEEAIVAAPADFRAAYAIFEATCARTVVNLSETHRKILNAAYELKTAHRERIGFSQRKIAEKAQVSQGSVSYSKTFLVQSAKLLVETEEGLNLVADAEPSWWQKGNVMAGIPTPDEVERWWRDHHPPDGDGGPRGSDHLDHVDRAPEKTSDAHASGGNGDQRAVDRSLITDQTDRDQRTINSPLIARNGLDTSNSRDREGVINVIRGTTEDGLNGHQGAQRRAKEPSGRGGGVPS
jgi:DNA primase